MRRSVCYRGLICARVGRLNPKVCRWKSEFQNSDRVLNKASALDLIRQHLDDTSRAAHSRFVAYLMRELASLFDANADIWEVLDSATTSIF